MVKPLMAACRMAHYLTVILWVTALLNAAWADGAPPNIGAELSPPPDPPQQRRPDRAPESGVYKARLTPHWLTNTPVFWYRNDLRDGAKEFIVVEADKSLRRPAFDHEKLAAALSKASGGEFRARQLPFHDIELSDQTQVVGFVLSNVWWKCDLRSWQCAPAATGETNRPSVSVPRPASGRSDHPDGNEAKPRPLPSPDGKWTASIEAHNVVIRSVIHGEETHLSRDGVEGNGYGLLEWSPDSRTLVAWRIEPGERKEVFIIASSPPGGGRALLKNRPYGLPGDKFSQYELNLFDASSGRQTKPAIERFEHEWERPRLHWETDQVHFAYQQEDRGHQRFRVIEIDSKTGGVQTVIEEKTDTFIWTTHTEMLRLQLVNWLQKSDEAIYVSERDGWRHLYLAELRSGQALHPITRGNWVVRGIDRIDEERRQVWFHAGGMNPDQDPYFLQYYRINFDGSGLVALTEGNGHHQIQFSPDREYLVDSWSRIDAPPVHTLRRASDGSLVCPLEEADIADLKNTGWSPPEVFVSKGRDGTTDIWGIICRPRGFDPAKKYPVIENIYAGPQGAYVPKSFNSRGPFSSLTDLGFVVVQIDAMGTAFRSKAFHDVCWKNLKDAGFPDRILWHKAAAAQYPWYDVSRVGIYGTSAGGQNAAGAVLFHPEFYRAAVANCGCHDNRMDKASWNEQWMGFPVGPHYGDCSNIDNAHRLRGDLFLIVGEEDTNVPPESTLRLVDALIKAGKDFDLLVVPGADHGIRGPAGEYANRRLQDFFVRHLLGQEPPNRNGAGD